MSPFDGATRRRVYRGPGWAKPRGRLGRFMARVCHGGRPGNRGSDLKLMHYRVLIGCHAARWVTTHGVGPLPNPASLTIGLSRKLATHASTSRRLTR